MEIELAELVGRVEELETKLAKLSGRISGLIMEVDPYLASTDDLRETVASLKQEVEDLQ